MIAVMVLSYIIQLSLNSKFDKYSRVPSPHGLTGADVARLMLKQNGIDDVSVQCVKGRLTDHYNPQDKTVNLSEAVYASASIAACAVAAHETGHAIQHATGYAPLRMRSALVPVVTFANNTVQWVLLLIPAGGFLWFSQSLLAGVMGVGTLIGWAACLAGAALILAVPAMVRKGGARRVIAWVFTGIFAGAVAWCAYLSTLIFSAVENTPPDSERQLIRAVHPPRGIPTAPPQKKTIDASHRSRRSFFYRRRDPHIRTRDLARRFI